MDIIKYKPQILGWIGVIIAILSAVQGWLNGHLDATAIEALLGVGLASAGNIASRPMKVTSLEAQAPFEPGVK